MDSTEYRGSSWCLPTTPPPLAAPTVLSPERSRVRHLLYGPPRAVRHTIAQLHQLHYVEQFRWSPVVEIPENGILITPEQGETYAFLLRELLLA